MTVKSGVGEPGGNQITEKGKEYKLYMVDEIIIIHRRDWGKKDYTSHILMASV